MADNYNYIFMMACVAIMGLCQYFKGGPAEGFRSTKCFSCERQMPWVGHGTKCFSCERQVRGMIPHGNKCFSCEN